MNPSTVVLPPAPTSVAAARRFTARVLSGSAAQVHCYDAMMLVDELVANAVLHAGTSIELRVWVRDGDVRLEVADGDAHLPQMLGGEGETMAGRGLRIVEALAHRWGVESFPSGGKSVWCELRTP